jgi:hypothetical protein
MKELIRLRRFLETPVSTRAAPQRCDFCGVAISDPHSHVVDLQERRLICSCRPCYLLFTNPGAGDGRFRSVGDRFESVDASTIDLAGFEMPIGMAFLIRNSKSNKVIAFYPSPGGAMESGLDFEISVPLEPDIEALLVYRRKGAEESWIVPVDLCYELVGRIRRRWRGFDGGSEVYEEIDSFFARLKEQDLNEQRSETCRI